MCVKTPITTSRIRGKNIIEIYYLQFPLHTRRTISWPSFGDQQQWNRAAWAGGVCLQTMYTKASRERADDKNTPTRARHAFKHARGKRINMGGYMHALIGDFVHAGIITLIVSDVYAWYV